MKKTLATFIFGALVGVPAGAFLWYAFSPLLFDEVVVESLTEAEVVASGTFRDADRAHQGQGIATLVALPGGGHEIQLSEFQVTNGPDLEVWLSAHPDPASSSDVADNPWVGLGQLKGNIGDQAYSVPADVNIADFQSVVIWCEQFGVLFSPAALSPPS
ncbi:DM13 domain-containing protein [Boseongicola aestuarii]|uniref:Electron transfer DM13 n=1 Tax=Boseongicola aestuarii TaxID=1470561 RepID=A0A238J019_9RHOB|nr:DM13 domain-containing protein [Boseongicola aestuarii]SMX23244.1 Electron transfer DM13 [Boseongicola aestuarii]